MNEATLTNDQISLLALSIPHFRAIGPEACTHYLRTENRSQIPEAFRRGFVVSNSSRSLAAPVECPSYPIEETDCLLWLDNAKRFTLDYFVGSQDDLHQFELPPRLPWKQVLVIYNPGISNMKIYNGVRCHSGIDFQMSDTSADYCWRTSLPSLPKLYIIERNPSPTPAAMGLPAKYALHWFGGRKTVPLPIGAYILGTSILNYVTGKFLDTETTTVFPNNLLPSSGPVVQALYDNEGSAISIKLGDATDDNPRFGFREAIVLDPIVR